MLTKKSYKGTIFLFVLFHCVVMLGSAAAISELPPDGKKRIFCEMLIGNIFDDINAIRDKYPELEEIKKSSCINGISMLYHSKAMFEENAGKRRGSWKLQPGGCVIKIKFYFGGYNWNDFDLGSDISGIYSLLSGIDANFQAKIISRNMKLRDEIEAIIRNRIKHMVK